MGIDVFVRRSALQDAPAPEENASLALAEPAPSAQSPTASKVPRADPAARIDSPSAPSAASQPAVEWDLVALTGGAGVVAGSFGTPEERRLANGIYVALGGGGGEPVQARFRWPPEGLGDRDARAAATALGAFLRGQVERAGAACLVLLGEELARLEVTVAVPIVRAPAARALIGDAHGKRSLWRRIATALK